MAKQTHFHYFSAFTTISSLNNLKLVTFSSSYLFWILCTYFQSVSDHITVCPQLLRIDWGNTQKWLRILQLNFQYIFIFTFFRIYREEKKDNNNGDYFKFKKELKLNELWRKQKSGAIVIWFKKKFNQFFSFLSKWYFEFCKAIFNKKRHICIQT